MQDLCCAVQATPPIYKEINLYVFVQLVHRQTQHRKGGWRPRLDPLFATA